jgi:hypothetical protein
MFHTITSENLPFQDASWKAILEETDWALLVKQKNVLQEITNYFHKNDKYHTIDVDSVVFVIKGILSFLDHVQDAAANDIGEEKIFGPICNICGNFMTPVMIDTDGTNLETGFECKVCAKKS